MMPQTETPNVVQVTNAPVAGFKTTEFYTTAATIIGIASGLVPPQYAWIVAALSGVYTVARTAIKAAHAAGMAKQIPDLPSVGE